MIMKSVKISSKMNQVTWKALQQVSHDTHQSISGLLSEAVEDYLKRRTLRDDVLRHSDQSMQDNEELGKLLAK